MKLLLILVLLFVSGYCKDVCDGPFSQFLQCTIGSVEKELDTLITEGTPKHRNDVKECFNRYGCNAPNFNEKDITGLFLSGEWKERIDNLLDFIDRLPTDYSFRRCMVGYFKKYAGELLEACVKKYGDSSMDDYEMQKIPGFNNIKISELRALFEVRMLTRHELLECYSCKNNNLGRVRNTYKCLEKKRSNRDGKLCTDRDKCIRQTLKDARPNGLMGTRFSTCEDRYDAVRKAGCKCGKEEVESGGLGIISRSKSLKKAIGLLFKKEFKVCYRRAGKTFPARRFKTMRSNIRQAIVDLGIDFENGGAELNIPDELKYPVSIAKSLIGEVVNKWTDVLCADCDYEKEPKTLEVKKLAKNSGRCGSSRSSVVKPKDTDDGWGSSSGGGGGGIWDGWDD